MNFRIPQKYQDTNNIVSSSLRAPYTITLGEAFYYQVYHWNNSKGVYRQIEIAENRKKSKIYGWSFHTKEKYWLWERKSMLDPNTVIDQLSLEPNTLIFAERVVHWTK